MQRRTFLSHACAVCAASATLPFSSRLLAATPDAPRFLLVFLRGGYDALSLLVPIGSSFYQEVRPHIAIPLAAGDQAGAVALNAQWALHPAAEAPLRPLLQARQLSFIPFAGTDDTSRSHFETQDSIELGQPLGAQRNFQSGFLNRLASVLPGNAAMSFTDQLPTVFRGPVDVANTSLKGQLKNGLAKPLQSALASMYQHHPLGAKVQEGFEVRQEVGKDMAGEMEAASRNAVSTNGFEQEARRMARLMRERYALGFVDVGGWDTHVGQGQVTGYLATRLGQLASGLAGFAEEMGPTMWKQTTVLVISEFGRTMRENGNRGTDHGHGSVYWALGGGLRGQPVLGEQTSIEARSLFQNRDLPVLNDYRATLAGLFQRQYGLSPSALDKVFPGCQPRDIGLI
ncbi:hypothetical protein JY96_07465 [Aquabacterium sp. NJ1]|uniref:DUF1501 domain-containing protein n=1 Tax=Aquabacterium sp. NJ1 TaxID=1538295 RepID=UPI00052BC9A0|nr:DUF1501 domain-containing protein [Aquabacterium sp. NJ1]KGM39923.1 hypothetical protein JY96_07465 [Aquabacterium sp. NJ1]